MDEQTQHIVTDLLKRAAAGNEAAADKAFCRIMPDVERIARRHLREEKPGTLETDAIVDEVFLKLCRPKDGPLALGQNRAEARKVVKRAVRQVLIDYYGKRKKALKRGHGLRRLPQSALEAIAVWLGIRHVERLALDEALDALAAEGNAASRAAKGVRLMYFEGNSQEEAAEKLNVSVRTVQSDWKAAKSFLRAKLAGDRG